MESQEKVTIMFENQPSRVIFSPTGVWGGVNGQGKIVANFFVETQRYPSSISVAIENGKVVKKTVVQADAGRERTYIREVLSTVHLDANVAEAIGKWLVKTAGECREVSPKKGDKADET